MKSGTDPGLVRTVWLLTQLPDAARSGNFAAAAQQLGITIPEAPSVADITTGLSAAIDDYLSHDADRSDVGEIALGAAVEATSRTLRLRTEGLFHEPHEATEATAALGTEAQFGRLARDFFARFTRRCLTSFIDRELPHHTGEGRRFQTLADQREFGEAIDLHCHQAARIVEKFAGSWWSKARFENDLSEARTGRFVAYSLKKLRDELTRGHDS